MPAPGSVRGVQLVVGDLEGGSRELVSREIDVTEIRDFPWGRFVFFEDPDGNRWSVQEIVGR